MAVQVNNMVWLFIHYIIYSYITLDLPFLTAIF